MRTFAIEARQPVPRIRQPDSYAARTRRKQPRSIIRHDEAQNLIRAGRYHLDCHWFFALAKTMANSVLNDWLKHHVWHENVRKGRRRCNLQTQPVREANLLDREVQSQELELAPERDFLGLDILKREAEEISEFLNHRFGQRCLLFLNQDHDGPQRIEEKVRLQLHPQGT